MVSSQNIGVYFTREAFHSSDAHHCLLVACYVLSKDFKESIFVPFSFRKEKSRQVNSVCEKFRPNDENGENSEKYPSGA